MAISDMMGAGVGGDGGEISTTTRGAGGSSKSVWHPNSAVSISGTSIVSSIVGIIPSPNSAAKASGCPMSESGRAS